MTREVYADNFPDPFVLRTDDGYLAFATNGRLGNVPMLRSDDLLSWEEVGDALGGLPAWSSPPRVWAPEVMRFADDRYVMYYTLADTDGTADPDLRRRILPYARGHVAAARPV